MQKTTIVIPCYNESKRLNPQLFLDMLDKEENLSFVFVNDGSTDGTLAILDAMQTKKPKQIEVISLVINSGKAESVRFGMLHAFEYCFDFVGYWDADLATPLGAISSFCRVLNDDNVDLVIGSRVRLLGRKVERKPIRHYLGRVFATITSLLLGISVYDTQCGAKIFRNTSQLQKVFESPFRVTWTFDVEILARLLILAGIPPLEASMRWVEYPLDEWADVEGSKVNMKAFILGGIEILLLFIYLCTPARKFYGKSITIT